MREKRQLRPPDRSQGFARTLRGALHNHRTLAPRGSCVAHMELRDCVPPPHLNVTYAAAFRRSHCGRASTLSTKIYGRQVPIYVSGADGSLWAAGRTRALLLLRAASPSRNSEWTPFASSAGTADADCTAGTPLGSHLRHRGEWGSMCIGGNRHVGLPGCARGMPCRGACWPLGTCLVLGPRNQAVASRAAVGRRASRSMVRG